MRIGVDIDNVLSNFNENLLKEYLIHDKNLRNKGIINNKGCYIRKGMFDWSDEEETTFYNQNIERIVTNLDVIYEAQKYINRLKDDGYEIYIITGRDNGEYSYPLKMTIAWLNKYNIKYDKLILTNAYNSLEKTEVCLKNGINIMIDDSQNVCSATSSNGITTLIMDTPYNRQISNITRVHNWKSIYDFITNYNKKINIILDTDTYNECDDQFAIAYMLKNQNIFNIEAITIAPYSHSKHKESIKDGLEKSYCEVLKICKFLNFDTTNKVFKGATNYICNNYNETNNAVNKIIEIALKNNKTYIMAIGAITNVSLAIQKEPKILDKIEVLWLGGHSILQDNNLEFNFKQDIDAVKIIFESKVKLTIIPCKNVASNLNTSIFELDHYLKDKNELCNYLIARFHNDTYHGLKVRRVIWDISVIAYMINKNWFTSNTLSCPKINDDTSYKLIDNDHKITMVNHIDANKVYKDLFEKLGE